MEKNSIPTFIKDGDILAKFGYCNNCKKELLNNKDFKLVRGKKICLDCHGEKINVALNIDSDKEDLFNFIQELFHISKINDGWIAQIEKFVKNNKYSYKGIKATLNYFYNIMENSINPEYGLGIIEYTYEEAKKFYQTLKEGNEYNESVEYSPIIQTITIKSPNKAIRIKTNMEEL